MALARTDRGWTNITPGVSTTTTLDSGTWTPAAGSLLVAFAYSDASTGTAQTHSLADTFSAGISWIEQVTNKFDSTYSIRLSIFTGVVGGSPSSGKVTLTTSNGSNLDRWAQLQVYEYTGQHATPVGATGSGVGNLVTSLNVTPSATTAATSETLGWAYTGGISSPQIVPPASWTELREDPNAWGAGTEQALIAGVISGAQQWSGLNGSDHSVAALLEVVAAAAAGLATPAPARMAGPGAVGPRAWQWRSLFTRSVDASTAPPDVTGSAANTLAGVSSSATAVETMIGSAANTLAGVTSTASGTESILGTAANTLAGVTSSASGTETISGTSAATLAGVTSAASGLVAQPVTGSAATTLDGVTSSASGTHQINVTGSAANTLAGVTSSAAGTENLSGSAANTLAGVTSAASAVESITGTAARTLAGVTSGASGLETITGTSATTLAGVSSSATGLSQINVTGTANIVLSDATGASNGTVANPVTGTSAATLSGVSSAASGAETLSGAAIGTLAGVSSSASGAVIPSVTGSGSAVLQGVTSTATSAPIPPALLAVVEVRRPAVAAAYRPRAVRYRRPGSASHYRQSSKRLRLPAGG